MFEELNTLAFVRSFTSGDDEVFRCVFARLASPLAVFIGRMGLNPADAEEVAADALLKVYKARQSYDPDRGAKLTTWIFRIAHNAAIDRVRADKAVAEAHQEFCTESKRIASTHPHDDGGRATHRNDAIHATFGRLGTADQDLLRMRQVMNYREIAAAEGATESAIRVRAKRAMDRLKQIIEEQTHE